MNTVKFKNSIFALAAMMLLTSCGSKDNNEPEIPTGATVVTVSPETVTAGPDAATIELTVKADADWAARTDADWLTIRPSGGIKNTETKIQLTFKANPSMDERETSVDIVSGGKTIKSVPVIQGYNMVVTASVKNLMMGGQATKSHLTINANAEWTLTTDASWLTLTPDHGSKGETDVEVAATANDSSSDREATITLKYGDTSSEIQVRQMTDAITAPEGYQLVWHDEFNEGTRPGKDWVLENWRAGYVNNELQTYTSREVDGKYTAYLEDGFLNITCFKGTDGKIYSARMNACPSTGWLNGYFEARINLPKGKGTWPAFWMMPCNVDWGSNPWPKCGEIDIMEEVGANPNYVSSSLHTENYNHTKGTQKTHEMYCAGAEGEFHVYACEWTENEIITYVDGKVQLRATKASMGADHDSWPFHYAFYPILNLAWGGDWGGYKGVDDAALPCTMKVDYVRIFQKK